jgi:ATP-dependent Clp protease adaptor protein ClpS
MNDTDIVEDIKIDEKIKHEISEPTKHRVILLNDEKTPMEWVIDVLKRIFNHSQETAEKLTLQIHNEGSGIAGIYSYEIAEQKSVETVNVSRDHGFPLQVRIEIE